MPALKYVEEYGLTAMLAAILPTPDLKPRGDVTTSPKQGHQWPHKKDLCPPKILKKSFLVQPEDNGHIVKNMLFSTSH